MPTTDQLETQLEALTARVNAIDGIGLPSNIVSALAQLQASDQGQIRDLKQSLLIIQQQMMNNTALVQQCITLINSKLGVT